MFVFSGWLFGVVRCVLRVDCRLLFLLCVGCLLLFVCWLCVFIDVGASLVVVYCVLFGV